MAEVQVPVEGTVCNWERGVQTNPITGEEFDFDGNKIYEVPVETSASAPSPSADALTGTDPAGESHE